MSKDKYIKTIDKIKASESFKKDTLLILEKEMNNNIITTPEDVADNTVIEQPQDTPMGKAVVNIEGKIVEVS